MAELTTTIANLKKKFGERSIRAASEIPNIRRVPLIEMPAFDYITGGGLQVSRINEFTGPQGSLKSWSMYKYLGKFQRIEWKTNTLNAFTNITVDKKGNIKDVRLRRGLKISAPRAKRVALIDIEGTYTPAWGEQMGIHNESMILVQPDRLSSAVDIAESLLADPDISLVCIDSISAVGTDEEIDGSMEDQQMGVAARFWSKAIRKLQSAINRNEEGDSTLLYINSQYSKVGFVLGDPEKLRNGEQLERSKSLSVRFRGLKELSEKIDGTDTVVGRNISLKCLKHKGGVSGRTSNCFYSYVDYDTAEAYSTDVFTQLIDLGTKLGVIDRSGNTYSYESYKANGFAKFVKLISDKGVLEEVRKAIYAEF